MDLLSTVFPVFSGMYQIFKDKIQCGELMDTLGMLWKMALLWGLLRMDPGESSSHYLATGACLIVFYFILLALD